MSTVIRPDISSRPLFMATEQTVSASPTAVFRAWTEQIDLWFAAPGSVVMTPEVNIPFFFETEFEGARAPHYGRFLRLEPARLIELVWVTSGTKGYETIVTVELSPQGDGTHVRLKHAGFPTGMANEAHKLAWPLALEQLEKRIGNAR